MELMDAIILKFILQNTKKWGKTTGLRKLGQNYKLYLKLGFNNIQCSKWNHTSNLYAKT